ncbi:MAG: GNAT family N-acetyltransferase [Betaproteobacteria bacterium]|nr:GNAT family N-acetyltransferase [Betaproteobacteria bacterium]
MSDSPDSFGETASEAEARPLSYWEDLTRSVTEPNRHVMFVAFEGDATVGTTYGLLDHERSDAGRVGGMWVAPSQRRRGVGRALLTAVLVWARESGLKRVGLWAPVSEPAAVALYSHAGFKGTGLQRPMPGNADLQISEMGIEL